MPFSLSRVRLGRSFSFRFLFLLTFALRTKSMALGATVLALVLIKVTGSVVCTSPTLRLIHITFEPFLSPPSFLRFQQWRIRHVLYSLVLRPLRWIQVRFKTSLPYFDCVRPSVVRTQVSGAFETKTAGPTYLHSFRPVRRCKLVHWSILGMPKVFMRY